MTRTVHRGVVSAIVAASCFALVVALFFWSPASPTTQTLVPTQDGFSFQWGSGRVNDVVGATVTVHVEAVPAHLVGRTCSVDGTVNGSPSQHPGNTLHVSTDGTTFDVLDVESVPDREQSFSGSAVLADRILFTVELGDGDPSPNRQTTSISGTAEVSCQTPSTTTSPSTTTEPPTLPTTTSTPTGSTVVPPPTSTPATTTSEPPSSDSTTTTAPTSPPSSTPPTTSPTTSPSSSPRISLDGDVLCPEAYRVVRGQTVCVPWGEESG